MNSVVVKKLYNTKISSRKEAKRLGRPRKLTSADQPYMVQLGLEDRQKTAVD